MIPNVLLQEVKGSFLLLEEPTLMKMNLRCHLSSFVTTLLRPPLLARRQRRRGPSRFLSTLALVTSVALMPHCIKDALSRDQEILIAREDAISRLHGEKQSLGPGVRHRLLFTSNEVKGRNVSFHALSVAEDAAPSQLVLIIVDFKLLVRQSQHERRIWTFSHFQKHLLLGFNALNCQLKVWFQLD